jgi:hypothetical protein
MSVEEILGTLKKTDSFNFEHINQLLSPYAIEQPDIENLRDILTDLKDDFPTPFLVTKLSVARLERAERMHHRGVSPEVRINVVLVFSNSDGTKKVYLKGFHSLSRADWQKLIQTINEKKQGIKYLMPKLNYRNLSDPDFKPGGM